MRSSVARSDRRSSSRSRTQAFGERDLGLERRPRGPVLTVRLQLPRSLALRARREVYSYPFPRQRQFVSRVLRRRLGRRRERFVDARVRIRLPRVLPLVRGSYVSVRGGVLNVHSLRQLERVLAAGLLNERHYEEWKSNRRKACNGQLDSPGATSHGLVAHAARRGLGMARLADAALVAHIS